MLISVLMTARWRLISSPAHTAAAFSRGHQRGQHVLPRRAVQFGADLVQPEVPASVALSICGRVISPSARSAAISSRFERIAAASSRNAATSGPPLGR